MDREEVHKMAEIAVTQGLWAGVNCFHEILCKTLEVGHVIPKEGDYILSDMGDFVYKQIKKHRPKESNQLKENLADAFEFGSQKGIEIYIDILEIEINSKESLCYESLVNVKPKIDETVEEMIKLTCIEVVTRH